MIAALSVRQILRAPCRSVHVPRQVAPVLCGAAAATTVAPLATLSLRVSAMRRLGLGIVLGVVCLSCGGGEVAGPPAVAVVRVSPAADTLLSLGATVQLSAVALDAAGRPIASKAFTWTSSAPAVATVDAASGLVTAVGNGVANSGVSFTSQAVRISSRIRQSSATMTAGGWASMICLNMCSPLPSPALRWRLYQRISGEPSTWIRSG